MSPTFSRREMLDIGAATVCSVAIRASAHGGSIDESGFTRIGGIEQWVAIQGRDIGNPVIVYLHGGPAEAQSPFLKEFVPWEHDFTVEYACRRLARKRVILVGQSWGATLGLRVAKQRPDLLYAFVGTGQQVSWTLTVQALDRWARQQAMRAGDQVTLADLARVSNLPPSDLRRRRAARKYLMSSSDLEYLKIQADFIGKPPFPSHGDVADWVAGGAFTIQRLLPAMVSFDARKLGLTFDVPFFVIQGRDDHVVSFDAARDYLAEVHAPRKAFVAIDGGHFACFTDPVEFLGALRRLVRPPAG